MIKIVGRWISNCSEFFFPTEELVAEQRPSDDTYKIVEQARREWQDARQRFEQVSDPDMIDSAIFAIEAAEKRYIYLLKKAREEREIQRLSSSP